MSMVGYILGLGDRHPSNLMLDRFSGKVIHIDFGDCFEVAMLRDKFPERVPFRLTRMLVNAMEVSGIEGTFRITCENVMRVLRENKESLMAVLEAFVYDPLINWRLLTKTSPKMAEPTKNTVSRRELGKMGGKNDRALENAAPLMRCVCGVDVRDGCVRSGRCRQRRSAQVACSPAPTQRERDCPER